MEINGKFLFVSVVSSESLTLKSYLYFLEIISIVLC